MSETITTQSVCEVMTIHESDQAEFDLRVNDAIENGWQISSTSSATCGPEYDYCLSLAAILTLFKDEQ